MKYTKKIEELEHNAKLLANNLEIAYGVKKCDICGCDPLKQVKYIKKLLHDFSEELIGEDKPPENIMRAVFRQEQRQLRDKLLKKR